MSRNARWNSALLTTAIWSAVVGVRPLVAAIDSTTAAVRIDVVGHQAPVAWAAEKLATAIRDVGGTAEVLSKRLADSKAAAFRVQQGGAVPHAPQTWEPGALPSAPEAYDLLPLPDGVEGRYADEAGGMYALLDLSERVRLRGVDALKPAQAETHRPTIAFRGVNPFLSIPLADKSGARDWEQWWFTDEEYWRGYLDLLAEARINWIDLHGMYDLQSTQFPNIWPYFVVSEKYPDVGVPPEQARRNLTMLEQVCHLAEARGIRIALMNYSGGWNWPGCRRAPDRPADDFVEYTKEGLTQIVRACPHLAMIGFRVGESGYGEDFYARSYVAALEELGRPLPLYTRTWGARKEKLLELGRMYPDNFYIEIKYNGEQLGPPWHVAGGRMTQWRDYSFQDYLFYPRAYKVLWQVRANGTHRVFQWASYHHIRACVQSTNLADSTGFCVEPMSAYYPAVDFLHKVPLYRWEYERNLLWYLMWGRLAYDPDTSEDVFRLAARRPWGAKYGDAAYALLQSFSRIVPAAKTQYSLGPDHRNHAPELEWGGSVGTWARGQPFDTFFAVGAAEHAREQLASTPTGRRTPLEAAALLDRWGDETRALAAALPDGVSPALNDLKLDAQMVIALGRYYAARLRAAAAYALADLTGSPEQAETAAALVRSSQERWADLARLGDEQYRPFLDTLRMGTQTYLWSQATPRFERDQTDLRTLRVSDVPDSVPAPRCSSLEPLDVRVQASPIDPQRGTQPLVVRAQVRGLARNESAEHVYLWWKPLRSESDWQRVAMSAAETGWSASVEIAPHGALYGVEIVTPMRAARVSIDGPRPYGVINPWPSPRE